MAQYNLIPPPVNIPRPSGGLISGFLEGATKVLEDRQAADAYAPYLDSVYGPAPSGGGFFGRLFGGGQQSGGKTLGELAGPNPSPAPAGAPPSGGGFIRSLMSLGEPAPQQQPQAQPAPVAAGTPQASASIGQSAPRLPCEAVERLLANPGTRRLGELLLPGGEIDFRRQQAAEDRDFKERSFAAEQEHRKSTLALQRRAFEEGRVSPGYRQGPNGVEFVPGGPADPAVIQAQASARGEAKPPTVETFYDDNGREGKRQWDPQSNSWVAVGGTKAPPQRPLPQATVNALSEAGAAYSDMDRINSSFRIPLAGSLSRVTCGTAMDVPSPGRTATPRSKRSGGRTIKPKRTSCVTSCSARHSRRRKRASSRRRISPPACRRPRSA